MRKGFSLLLTWLFLAAPVAVQAQFKYAVSNGSVTITGYTGPGGAVAIPGTIAGMSVTGIGRSAFDSCTSLSSVTIPASVTSIGDWAFGGCSNLTSVTIPNGVTSIGSGVFCGTKLASVTIPGSVTSIGFQAFANCLSLTSVSIPGSVTSIGDYAFSCCSLTSVTIPGSVTSIGSCAFEWCITLSAVYFHGDAPTADSTVFSNDVDLAAVFYLPGTKGWGATFAGITAIEQRDVNYTIALSSAPSAGGTVAGMGKFAMGSAQKVTATANSGYKFYNWTENGSEVSWEATYPFILTGNRNLVANFSTISYGKIAVSASPSGGGSVSGGGTFVFYTSQTVTASANRDFTFTGWTENGSIVSTDSWYNFQVTGDRNLVANFAVSLANLFTTVVKNNTVTITGFFGPGGEVTIPSKINGLPVTGIGVSAFQYANITSVEIPSGVTSIGDYAFQGCSTLHRVTIPDTVTTIGNYAFNGCIGLTCLAIPNSVTSIGSSAFSDANLTSLAIPDSVTRIGTGAFSSGSLAIIVLGKNVTSIPDEAFYGCSSLTTVTIPNSVITIGNQAFYGCTNLTNIVIPDSVTNIGNGAFLLCTSLTKVTIGSSVTAIGAEAFEDCTSLPSVTIPNSVTNIGSQAFESCTALTSVTIGNGVTTIGSGVFGGCTSLTSVTIPNSVTSIGGVAFEGCTSLAGVTIGNRVNSIGDEAFSGCVALISVKIPSSVTSIGTDAFIDCTSLMSLAVDAQNSSYSSVGGVLFDKLQTTLIECPCRVSGSYTAPSTVTDIGNSAFYDCAGLTSVTIPGGVTNVGSHAFAGCTGLTVVYCQGNGVPFALDAFTSDINLTTFDGNLTAIYYPKGATGWGTTWNGVATLSIPNGYFPITVSASPNAGGTVSGAVVVPAGQSRTATATANSGYTFTNWTENGSVVSTNASYTFTVNSNRNLVANFGSSGAGPFLTTVNNNTVTITGYSGPVGAVTIPSKIGGLPVTGIGAQAFSSRAYLTSITIPSSITVIGDSAFYSCSGLRSVSIPKGVISIGSDAFSGCSSLANVALPNTVTNIGDRVFFGCTGLRSVSIPYGVTSIGNSAFYDCSSLANVALPSTVASIGSGAFSDCSHLAAIAIPNGVISIADQVFYGCTSLVSVTIPSSVTSIGAEAFYRCVNLTDVTIPASVTSIGEGAFSNCSNLMGVAIPSSVTSVGNDAFAFCYNLAKVSIPSGIPSIGGDAFQCCTSLTSVTIPGNVASVGDFAFYNCSSLTSVTMAKGVVTIGESAFDGCGRLTSVAIPSSVTSIGAGAFAMCTGLTSVAIPSSVTSIGNETFRDCTNLTGIVIPNSVTSIGDSAFQSCVGLSNVTMGGKVTNIGADAFAYCRNLHGVTIPVGVASIGNEAFLGCTSLTSVSIPGSVTYVSYKTFLGCTGLTTLTIGDGVTSIGGAAFALCSGLTRVTIPDSVTSIGSLAFDSCTSLNATYFQGNAPSADSTVFFGDNKLTAVYWLQGTSGWGATFAGVTAIQQAVPVITWPAPTAITYGAALSSTQLDATASAPGVLVYSPAAGTVLGPGTQTLHVTFTPTDTKHYTTATAAQKLTVNKVVAVITWAAPTAIIYGTPLSSTQLNATANVPGALAYSPAAGALLGAGLQALHVTFTPTDTIHYATVAATRQLTVNKAVPVITWPALATIPTGTALSSTQLKAKASVPGAFVYTPAAGTVLSANTYSLKVTFTPTDTTDYAVTTATQTLIVSSKTIPVITWPAPAAITYGKALSATQLNATASVPGAFVYTPATGAVLNAGSQILNVRFTPTNTTTYAATAGSQTLTVAKAAQTINFPAPGNKTYGSAPFNLWAAATSGQTVTFSVVSGPAKISGTTVTLTGAGTVTIRASQPGSANYNAATPVDHSFTVAKAAQTITFGAPGNKVYGAPPFNLSGSATSGLALTFSVVSGPATISGRTVTLTGPGTVTLQASQAGNANYNAATSVIHSFTVVKAATTATAKADSEIVGTSNDDFLRQLFVNVLGRQITAGELSSIDVAMTAGESRADVLGDLLASAEYSRRQIDPAIRLYYAAFARVPDYADLQTCSRALAGGKLTLAAAADQVAGSAEFLQRYGALDNTQYVQQLYFNVLGRDADAASLAAWVGRLDAGASRGAVLAALSQSPEFKAEAADTVEILRLYFVLLRRIPTAAELQGWEDFLQAGDQAGLAAAPAQPDIEDWLNDYITLDEQMREELLADR